MIGGLIINLLNVAWSRKHEMSKPSLPFNKLVITNPTVPNQTVGDSTMYTCLFALAIFRTRNLPYFDEDYTSNCRRVTEICRFSSEDASRLMKQMKLFVLMSISNKRNKKRVNQVQLFKTESSVSPSPPSLDLKRRKKDIHDKPVGKVSSQSKSTTSLSHSCVSEKDLKKKKEAELTDS